MDLKWCDKFRLTVNIGKCSATKLSAPMATGAKAKAREAISEWRKPIEAERKRKVEERKKLKERGEGRARDKR